VSVSKELIRRTVEIDYTQGHRHLAGSLSALPIIAGVYERLDPAHDVFILSKGHAAPALYAVLESRGYKPDVRNAHPERDPANGIVVTTGSLGHGLPLAVGFALAKKLRGEPGVVSVLLGDGETLEGTTWESLHLAKRLGLDLILDVHVDANGWQGSCRTICATERTLCEIFPVMIHHTRRGDGVPYFEEHSDWHTHTITPEEFAVITKQLP